MNWERMKRRTPLRPPLGGEAILGTVLGGRYTVEEWIGGGAFSNVYLGYDSRKENRPVAIKVIHKAHALQATNHSQFKEGNPFEHEARYNKLLKNGWVARAYTANQTPDGINYIVMEYVPGPTLEWWIRNQGILSPVHAFQLAVGLLTYLEEAHGVGFAHGDIKSTNIVLSNVSTDRFRFKVVDLGHASWFRTPIRPRRHLVGTPAYLAPELVDGGTVDPRAEVYAVAVVLFKAVTGKTPIQTRRNNADEMLEALRDSGKQIPTQSILEWRPEFPPEFARWIEKGLSRNRALRPSTVSSYRQELEDQIAGMDAPLASFETSAQGVFKQWVKRLFPSKD